MILPNIFVFLIVLIFFPIVVKGLTAGQNLFARYLFGGKAKMDALRRQAEESGDLSQLFRYRFVDGAATIAAMSWCGFTLITGVLTLLALSGMQGVGMDTYRSCGSLILLIVSVFVFASATVMRRYVSRFVLREDKAKQTPRKNQAEFCVYSFQNRNRIDMLMGPLALLPFLSCASSMLLWPIMSLPAFLAVAGVVLFFIYFFAAAVREEYSNVKPLLLINEAGITYYDPVAAVRFVPWNQISSVSRRENQIVVYLIANDPDPANKETAVFDMSKATISTETIQKKIHEIRRLITQQILAQTLSEQLEYSDT